MGQGGGDPPGSFRLLPRQPRLRAAPRGRSGGVGAWGRGTRGALPRAGRGGGGAVASYPRLDLAEADVAQALGDYRREQAAASRAAAQGAVQGARLLAAQARLLEAYALGRLGQGARAMIAAEDARRIYAD